MSRRRIVVTGMGIVSPVGSSLDLAWSNILAGNSGIRPITKYDVSAYTTRFAGTVSDDFKATDYLGPKEIRINAISAGPVRTLAARSIAGFTTMEEMFEQRAPLHRAIDAADCGAAAAYLLSDDARNVSGTTLYVDAGYHAMGM